MAPVLLGSKLDWKYETIPNNVSCLAYRKQQCRFSRGQCLGGSTSVNYMMYTRGNPKDFDDLNISGWAWEDVKPYFLKYEGLQDLEKLPKSSIPYHNTTGTMKVEFFTDSKNPWHPRIVEGFKQLKFPFNPDVNAQSKVGVTQVLGFVYDNLRMSTARGYLARDDVNRVLKVAKWTRCTGVIINDDNTAQGVTVIQGLFERKRKIYARKEVILSAGAIGTPQILMLSGIGPAEHLKEMNITVKADLPVGENMTDHLLPLVFVKVKDYSEIAENLNISGITSVKKLIQICNPISNCLTDVSAFMNSNCYDFENRQLRNDRAECEVATLQFIHAYIARFSISLDIFAKLFQRGTDLNDAVVNQLQALSWDYAFITVTPAILQPYSQGYVRLASTDPLATPAIFPNFLSDERDLEEMVRAITIIEHLMDTPPFKKQNASVVRLELPGCPDYSSDRVGYWRCYSRHMTHTVYHAVGTAALGRALDARLRVRGVRALRVADLSAAPRLPRANTAATAIAIGERAADFILEDNAK
ncbi:hypothetical protein ABMA28_016595 [Loxostege sticticalis]|uniref:Glucose-methanol-choline oxidoreductase N-terminal domain-containing protein n=1 Tax=Loxostege sticticalis TaxID=481309 RepID=A0ABD0T530_LOXSC